MAWSDAARQAAAEKRKQRRAAKYGSTSGGSELQKRVDMRYGGSRQRQDSMSYDQLMRARKTSSKSKSKGSATKDNARHHSPYG